jgi:multidrug efflux system membrane fusion protein
MAFKLKKINWSDIANKGKLVLKSWREKLIALYMARGKVIAILKNRRKLAELARQLVQLSKEKIAWVLASKKRKFLAAFFTLILLVLFAGRLYYLKLRSLNDKAILVATAAAHEADIDVYVSVIGTVTPKYSVTVKPQVSGELIKVYFKEGQNVKTGELLAEIDQRPYIAQLNQYEGQLVRDKALLENAKLDLQRYQTLWDQNSVSKQVLDTQISLVNQYEGTVEVDAALVENAKVSLSYCQITSPIDGQVGLRLIDEGNIVDSSAGTSIVIINTIDPITVVFAIPEIELPKVAAKFNKDKAIPAFAYDHEQTELLATGTLIAIDNQIDLATGTIKLKAEFANANNGLFANQFTNIKLLIDKLSNVLVVPVSAVQYGRESPYVYKVDANNKVQFTNVALGVTSGDNIMITSGLAKGDIVVTQGGDKLIEGSLIKEGKGV